MTPFVTAGAGFLLAVLWFDLMFDVQVLRHRRERAAALPDPVLASIAGYYGRVTTAARPMNRLIGLVMLGTLAALILQTGDHDTPEWAAWACLGLATAAIGIAVGHTFPSAVRLGTRRDDAGKQSRLARGICRDHLLCLAAIASVLAIQLAFAG